MVDEVEVYRNFGGYLPAVAAAAGLFNKTSGRPAAQKDSTVHTIQRKVSKEPYSGMYKK
ncbi:hypothetical protein [Aneurinibacillus tyrosinisolvens]|uniref:hypothetical protein n=1 Tax=Aneurinibacillus tyrosinisolvens TaxID=1443435 RepID=UPI000A8A8E5B|nr:hypothetical protein [Aneurinibacillus tyrosinisolvens]